MFYNLSIYHYFIASYYTNNRTKITKGTSEISVTFVTNITIVTTVTKTKARKTVEITTFSRFTNKI